MNLTNETSFDTIAPFYDVMADLFVGKSYKNSQILFLEYLPENASILILGAGSGRITKDIKAIKKFELIDLVDSSLKMRKLAEKWKMKYSEEKIHIYEGDENFKHNTNNYNVVITQYFLDMFNESEIDVLAENISKVMPAKGLWLISDFHIDKDSNWFQRKYVALMYIFFKKIANIKTNKLPSYEPILLKHSFLLLKESFFKNRLIKTQLWVKQ